MLDLTTITTPGGKNSTHFVVDGLTNILRRGNVKSEPSTSRPFLDWCITNAFSVHYLPCIIMTFKMKCLTTACIGRGTYKVLDLSSCEGGGSNSTTSKSTMSCSKFQDRGQKLWDSCIKYNGIFLFSSAKYNYYTGSSEFHKH